ncbi:MAG: DNA polymerase I [Bacteroidales bacterium]|nr:DNA polymerase I [Bacteroidales bacterium]
MKKLVIIDGMAAIYRGYYAMNTSPRVNSKGLNTSAAFGFTLSLYDILRSQRPTHMAVAFDLPAPTFRHEMYPEYKANRDPMPEDIQSNIPWITRIIDAFRIPQITCEGFEADDVVGTVSAAAERAGFDDIIMVTPDKDFAQLVTSHIRLYRYGRGKTPDAVLGVQDICTKFNVSTPRQVIDLLGLWGDAIDNIPGIKGVGEKTAQKLIAQFGSIEEMVNRVDEIKNEKLRENVRQHTQDALFSKQLATIRLDAPIDFDENSLLLHQPDYELLFEICSELEFKQLARRIQTDLSTQTLAPAAVKQPTLDLGLQIQTPQTVNSQPDDSQLSMFAPTPSQAPQVTRDTSPMESLRGRDLAIYIDGPTIALSTDADSAWVTTVAELDSDLFAQLLSDPSTLKLCFNLKNLKYILAELLPQQKSEIGIQNFFDVQLVHYLIDAEMRHSLDFICSGFLGFEPTDAASSAAALWQLYPVMMARLCNDGLEEVYNNVELPLVDVLISMEREGVRIDVDALRRYANQLAEERQKIEQQIYSLAGVTFNIASPRQLGEVLYEQLKVTDKPPRTATKQYSTAEDVLNRLSAAHPIIPLILEYRSITKLIGTYLDSFPKLINHTDNRIHTAYNQTVTATGRLSSSNPNLQNIPIRTERGREIRRAFVPRDDEHLLLAADYSQIELRIIASLAKDEHMIEAFRSGLDIHAATAARIYGLPIEEVSAEQRRSAKSVNFGIVYGISAFGLAEQLHIPRKQAASLIEEYFNHYPAISQFIEQSKEFARSHGYARTLMGRRRYLPDINSRNASARSFAERNAVNMPIQGTSADMIKLAMVHIHNQLMQRHLRSRMILQVHDELVFDLYKPETDEVRDLVMHEMQNALPLENIPIEVSVGIGTDWLQAH